MVQVSQPPPERESVKDVIVGAFGLTGALVLADGTVFEGYAFGAPTTTVGEVCFNTAMTGYEEILTDPSYAGQIITFTFPHIGNVGANDEDIETLSPVARGLVLRADVTEPSNWRARAHLDAWLKAKQIVGISGVDTRALTRRIRDLGAPNGALMHAGPKDTLDAATLDCGTGARPIGSRRPSSGREAQRWALPDCRVPVAGRQSPVARRQPRRQD